MEVGFAPRKVPLLFPPVIKLEPRSTSEEVADAVGSPPTVSRAVVVAPRPKKSVEVAREMNELFLTKFGAAPFPHPAAVPEMSPAEFT